ncbi:hypothetical protein K469DRAFT_711792 [Zopfia rhizophila CBS 207.26]|uniref:Uncharacterized protein n=1 Tax=Zopfia rhizophila CBS 207.26 TaxID=1314779 RepID=A0A6A6DV21_9PEZI|nr:hypothetical protein K469DRAFT_711792 [Zopfia rhizophila CBS 207.26]
MPSGQSNASNASSTTAPTDQENSASTIVDGEVNDGNRQTGGATSNNTPGRPEVASASTPSLQVTDISETQHIDLTPLSQRPGPDGDASGSNS